MLRLPDDPSTTVAVMGIDPGTITLGVGIIYFDALTFEMTRSEAYTFNGGKLPGSDWVEAIESHKRRRIMAHQQNFQAMLERVTPLAVACESSYININRPSAYGPLVEIVSALRDTLYQFDKWRTLYMITPGEVKNAVGAKGGAGKDPVKAGMLLQPDLVRTCRMDISELDEHSVDALAVAYCKYKAMRDST